MKFLVCYVLSCEPCFSERVRFASQYKGSNLAVRRSFKVARQDISFEGSKDMRQGLFFGG